MGVCKDIRRTHCVLLRFLLSPCFSFSMLSLDLWTFAETLQENIVFSPPWQVCCPLAAIAVISTLLLGLTEPDANHQGAVQLVTVTTSLFVSSFFPISLPLCSAFHADHSASHALQPALAPSSVCLLSAAVCLSPHVVCLSSCLLLQPVRAWREVFCHQTLRQFCLRTLLLMCTRGA